MRIFVTPHGSVDYWAGVHLREEVLRKPLGLTYSAKDLEDEAKNIHFVVVEDQILLATLQLAPLHDKVIKMRQVAVLSLQQSQGVGRKIVEFSEAWARDHRYTQIRLHARKAAIPFYQKLAYEIQGDEFIEVGLPHCLMIKDIS